VLQARTITNNPRSWVGDIWDEYDILKDYHHYPVVLQLQDRDGGIQHAITVVDDYIFDSNCDYALPRTQKALDWCCSTDFCDSTFQRVYRGYVFVCPTDNTKKRKTPLWQTKTRNMY
jgi:hypothetical protein